MSGKVKIFIDGSEGTTGLRIHERFAEREDVELLPISSELRKDKEERKRLINSSDITFLCLPDAAAEESVSLVENDHVRIIGESGKEIQVNINDPDFSFKINPQKAEK